MNTSARGHGQVLKLVAGNGFVVNFVAIGPGIESRYTLYPVTGDALAAQARVMECGLTVTAFCCGSNFRTPRSRKLRTKAAILEDSENLTV